MTDERVYLGHARALAQHGIGRGFRLNADRFLENADARHYPSPIRWLWLLALRLTLRAPLAVPVASALAIAPAAWWAFGLPWWSLPLLVSSPLLWITARRVWVDAPVALLTILGLGFASRGEPTGLAACVFGALALREASALAVPALAVAWLLGGHALLPLGASLAFASVAYLIGCRLVVGPKWFRVMRAASGGHATEYTRQHQSGGAHRLLVDLVLLSPVACFLSVVPMVWPDVLFTLLALLVFHGLAPVNNIRTVLALDVFVRAQALHYAVDARVVWLLCWLVVDALVLYATRKIYDPVTANLTAALGMSPRT